MNHTVSVQLWRTSCWTRRARAVLSASVSLPPLKGESLVCTDVVLHACMCAIMPQRDGSRSSLTVSEVSSRRVRRSREPELNARPVNSLVLFPFRSPPAVPSASLRRRVSSPYFPLCPSSVIPRLSSHPVFTQFWVLRAAPGKSFPLSLLMPLINYSYAVSVLFYSLFLECFDCE